MLKNTTVAAKDVKNKFSEKNFLSKFSGCENDQNKIGKDDNIISKSLFHAIIS